MPTYLHGLILSRNAGRVPAGLRGIADAPLRAVVCDGLAAIVSAVAASPSVRDRDAIVRHDTALGRVVRHAITAVASRFGQTFSDEDALRAELAASRNRASITATLERWDGCGEMRIVMRDPVAPPVPARASAAQASPGRAYLESVREKLRPRLPFDLRALLGALVLDERVERFGDAQTVSHLVRFEDETPYRALLSAQSALQEARVTGPHALYAFAEPAG